MAKGFKYYYDDEKIREYMKFTAEQKLRWLEEVRQFNQLALSPKSREIMGKFRRAEI